MADPIEKTAGDLPDIPEQAARLSDAYAIGYRSCVQDLSVCFALALVFLVLAHRWSQ